ncbi:OsmC family peroxiredoxin [Chryseobacterium lacus]|uniref:OsmC family peroxiredoxin n=1 Tax=Chryseobacterium lacus TaxID=2058346 RepID=A0A368MZ27_9FLAO|nr:OsmC family protein [Chryseobacterium lacus]RCU43468.1 OsmC family peroxiredoxin [Chryseobacterium lacus]RST28482.1 OsmC family peroxiredoxin [Chryseobacterium lacus]
MTSKIKYIGDLRCEAEHLQSGTVMMTDAPTDNHGKGEKFSPTDLCATSLAECALTTIAILGKSQDLNIEGATCELQKIMLSEPRRIGEIICYFDFPGEFSDDEIAFIETTAQNCPVAKSLHPDLKQTMRFKFGK